MALVRNNALCVAIKKKLKATPGIKLIYNQDIWKRKEIEMTYSINIDSAVFNLETFDGLTKPAQVINPLIALIRTELEAAGVTKVHDVWGSHVPQLGLLPIVHLYWFDAGVAIYVKK